MGKAQRKKQIRKRHYINGIDKNNSIKYQGIFLIIIIIFSLVTFKRNVIWINWENLWTNVIKNSPEKGRGYVNLGIGYENSNIDKAFEIYKQALAAAKDNFYVHYRLAQIYEKKEMNDLAIKEYAEALDPTKVYDMPRSSYAEAYLGFGLLLQKRGFNERAVINYKKAIDISPDSLLAYKAHNNMGTIYGERGFYDDAIEEFKYAIKIDPNLPDAYNNIGVEYAKKGLYKDALQTFQTVLKLNPNDSMTIQNITAVEKDIKDLKK